jgi:hypothetical protein
MKKQIEVTTCLRCHSLIGFRILSKKEIQDSEILIVKNITCEACQEKIRQYIIQKIAYLNFQSVETKNAPKIGPYVCQKPFKMKMIKVNEKDAFIENMDIEQKLEIEKNDSLYLSHLDISELTKDEKQKFVLVLISINKKSYVLFEEFFPNIEKKSKIQ